MLANSLISGDIGHRAYDLAERIFPIFRSLTGSGVRETLAILNEYLPLTIHEVASGTKVLDWTVPREWTVRQAYIADHSGRRIVDIATSNLHLLHYSVPVQRTMPRDELAKHIHTLPEQPDLIPYRTSYYKDAWGFCMSHRQFEQLNDETYTIVIDSDLIAGSLTYGECLIKGETADEMLLSAHICHPSLANDNCSGLALLAVIGQALGRQKTRLSYRIVFGPGTIGSITWLAHNRDHTQRIKHGLVVSCAGDAGGPVYKRSRRHNAAVDRAAAHVLSTGFASAQIIDFFPYGYDERQYCSPGFNLPVGLLQRSQFGTFPEYHTSADNLDFIAPEHLASSAKAIADIIEVLENDVVPVNLLPFGEPQLGDRGLYAGAGANPASQSENMPILWLLNLADGTRTLLDIAEQSKLPFWQLLNAAFELNKAGLLRTERTSKCS